MDLDGEVFERVCKTAGPPEIPLTMITNEDGESVITISPCLGGIPAGDHVNSENVETYAIWPFEYYGVNRTSTDYDVGLNTFENVQFGHANSAWRYDGQDSAILGLAEDAWRYVVERVTQQGTTEGSQFPGYLASDESDGAPQVESNGIAAVTLQKMLLQEDGRRLLLFPAWLRRFDVEFKLRFGANLKSGAEGGFMRVVLKDGEVTTLEVEPKERLGDVVVLDLQ